MWPTTSVSCCRVAMQGRKKKRLQIIDMLQDLLAFDFACRDTEGDRCTALHCPHFAGLHHVSLGVLTSLLAFVTIMVTLVVEF